ncbi:MAG TPA: polyprenyl synthetase family protein [Cyclobacteriaceae bacterium]|nr:polyprenyl synthetase family protein [Cyclobacteriaceae bacterium]
MTTELSWIEREIKRQRFGEQPRSLYEPIRYIMALGGKRVRPMLTLLAYQLYRTDAERIVPYAVAVEAFHNFTLLHDDIMDKAPLRRGKATVHEKWNVNTAILSGDVMLVKVYDMLLGLPADQLKTVLPLFNACAAGVCEGQQWDMEFEAKAKVTQAQYIEMIRLKTAVLLGFSLEFGAVIAGASEKDCALLQQAGTHLGIGFQLKDDLLDVYGDQKTFGKQVGGDILSNKKTFLLIHALATAKGKDKAELRRWLTAKKYDPRKKVNAITALYNKLGVREATEKKIKSYFDLGFADLQQLSAGAKTSELIQFAEQLADRQR